MGLVNNIKGQGLFNYFIALALFILVWVYALAKILADWGYKAVTENGMTGLEAFLYSNLNLLIFVVIVFVTVIAVVSN